MSSHIPVESYLADFNAASEPARVAARNELIAASLSHFQQTARRMLRRFPLVRRWNDTDDIVQNAAIRLHRALATVVPRDARHWFSLVSLQVRRELLDLARQYQRPESAARQHETNRLRIAGEEVQKTALIPAAAGEPNETLAAWTRLHEVAAGLPDEERELFHLVWYGGLTQNEIASLLGCSVRTVRRRWEETKRQVQRDFRGESPAIDDV